MGKQQSSMESVHCIPCRVHGETVNEIEHTLCMRQFYWKIEYIRNVCNWSVRIEIDKTSIDWFGKTKNKHSTIEQNHFSLSHTSSLPLPLSIGLERSENRNHIFFLTWAFKIYSNAAFFPTSNLELICLYFITLITCDSHWTKLVPWIWITYKVIRCSIMYALFILVDSSKWLDCK